MAGGSHGLRLVIHQDVDDAIAMLHAGRTYLLWLEDAQTTALHHGGPAHANIAALGGDDHVAATQQRGVASKAAPGCDSDDRNLAVEPRVAGKCGDVQAGNDGHVHIARSATPALGKQHDRQLVLQRDAQHAVGLLVVAHALRTGQHGSVVCHGDDGLAVDLAQAGDHAVGRGVLDQIFGAAAAALGGHGQCAVFVEAAGVAQVGDVLAGAA